MEQLVITIEGKTNTDLLIQLMRKFNFVKSVIRKKTSEPLIDKANILSEPVEEYNWTKPKRPATDEEFEQMIAECEASPSMTAEEAKKYTYKLLDEWSRRKK